MSTQYAIFKNYHDHWDVLGDYYDTYTAAFKRLDILREQFPDREYIVCAREYIVSDWSDISNDYKDSK